jgi:hypothetical protein
MKLHQPHARSRADLQADLESLDRERISTALISAALNDPNREWVETIIIQFIAHEDPWLRGVSALAAGHIARLHGDLDARILPLIEKLLEDPETSGKARDALDDIEMFLGRRFHAS